MHFPSLDTELRVQPQGATLTSGSASSQPAAWVLGEARLIRRAAPSAQPPRAQALLGPGPMVQRGVATRYSEGKEKCPEGITGGLGNCTWAGMAGPAPGRPADAADARTSAPETGWPASSAHPLRLNSRRNPLPSLFTREEPSLNTSPCRVPARCPHLATGRAEQERPATGCEITPTTVIDQEQCKGVHSLHFRPTLYGGSGREIRREQGIRIREEELKLSLL